MKWLLIALAGFFFTCTNIDNKAISSDSKTVSPDKSYSTTETNDTTIHPLLQIGGCYIYKINADSIAGLILHGIEKDEDVITYSFFITGKFFSHPPDINEFKKGGIWGRKIPSGIAGPNDFSLSFHSIDITEKKLSLLLDKLTLLETVAISNKDITGSSGYVESLNEIPREITLFTVLNAKIEKGKNTYPIPEYPYEIVAWENLPLAKDNTEAAAPVSIWRLTKKTANPKAVQLITDDWFWNEVDDLSPFGNDDGADALISFKSWREKHKDSAPEDFIHELEREWGLSFTHLNVTSESDLPDVEAKNQFYRSVDRGIIAAALAQIALEGKISPGLKDLGTKATKRAMTSFGMNGMSLANRAEYKSRFEKILIILNQF